MAASAMEELVGREGELAAVDAFLDRATTGPAALLVEGEAGIGKTTLWAAGVERARERGFGVLLARPAEAERTLSFAALSDLLVDVHDSRSEKMRRRRGHGRAVPSRKLPTWRSGRSG